MSHRTPSIALSPGLPAQGGPFRFIALPRGGEKGRVGHGLAGAEDRTSAARKRWTRLTGNSAQTLLSATITYPRCLRLRGRLPRQRYLQERRRLPVAGAADHQTKRLFYRLLLGCGLEAFQAFAMSTSSISIWMRIGGPEC